MTSIYRYILKQAWDISWRNRWLWVFGLFAALLGSGGEYNILINNISTVQNEGAFLTSLKALFSQSGIGVWFETLKEIAGNLSIQSILLLAVTLALSLVVLWLSLVSQGSLVSGIFRFHKHQLPTIGESWRRGVSKFWSVLGVNLIGKLILYLILIILGLPFFFLFLATQNLLWQWILIIISFLIFIPLAIIISFLVKYAVIFTVTKNNDVRLALQEAWDLFKRNWIVSLEMALLLFIINVAAGLGLILGLLFISIPFFILGFIAVYFTLNGLFWFTLTVGGIIAIVALFTFGAVLATFQTSVWVILFTRLTEGIIIPKILRLAAVIPHKFKKKSPLQEIDIK